jgi:peptidoglycan/xylan/chitin deacetylase (PgdA/CDA1 family)
MKTEWPLILTYHHIVAEKPSRYALDVAYFEAQLSRLLQRGYRAVNLETAIETGPLGSGDAQPKTFTVTFDDGLASLRELGLPVLRKLDLISSTTVFVPTAFVGERNEWSQHAETDKPQIAEDPAAPLMSWDELAELAEEGMAIESHGHRHLAMDSLSHADALADASASMRALREHGFPSRYLALPFGWHSPDAKRAIADAGFEAALSVTRGGSDRFEIRRVPLYGTDGVVMTRLKLSGHYWRTFDLAVSIIGKRRQ